ncbi:unnamed protein product [Meloidogyne enterolobii]|uniref:Uncharacterized protein n=1 Tax=Meloidogyne enterolobii TaxID=390850 RepID=A0ACB1AAX5_MELEN
MFFYSLILNVGVMQTGQPQQVHANPPTFSLTELSFLMKILDSTETNRAGNAFNVYDIQINGVPITLKILLALEGALALDRARLPRNDPIGEHGLLDKIQQVYTLKLPKFK